MVEHAQVRRLYMAIRINPVATLPEGYELRGDCDILYGERTP